MHGVTLFLYKILFLSGSLLAHSIFSLGSSAEANDIDDN